MSEDYKYDMPEDYKYDPEADDAVRRLSGGGCGLFLVTAIVPIIVGAIFLIIHYIKYSLILFGSIILGIVFIFCTRALLRSMYKGMRSKARSKRRKKRSRNKFERAWAKAQKGDAMACFQVYQCYYNGEGIDKDLDEADKWLQKACDKNLGKAWLERGNRCLKGVLNGAEKALPYFEKAAQYGDDNDKYLAYDHLVQAYEARKDADKKAYYEELRDDAAKKIKQHLSQSHKKSQHKSHEQIPDKLIEEAKDTLTERLALAFQQSRKQVPAKLIEEIKNGLFKSHWDFIRYVQVEYPNFNYYWSNSLFVNELKQLSSEGCVFAMGMYAKYLLPRDKGTAYLLAKKSADAGDASACYLFSKICDDNEAKAYFDKAVQLKEPRALFEDGLVDCDTYIPVNGNGLIKEEMDDYSPEEAAEIMRKFTSMKEAASLGLPAAQYELVQQIMHWNRDAYQEIEYLIDDPDLIWDEGWYDEIHQALECDDADTVVGHFHPSVDCTALNEWRDFDYLDDDSISFDCKKYQDIDSVKKLMIEAASNGDTDAIYYMIAHYICSEDGEMAIRWMHFNIHLEHSDHIDQEETLDSNIAPPAPDPIALVSLYDEILTYTYYDDNSEEVEIESKWLPCPEENADRKKRRKQAAANGGYEATIFSSEKSLNKKTTRLKIDAIWGDDKALRELISIKAFSRKNTEKTLALMNDEDWDALIKMILCN